jgi:Fe-S-cluster-containing hydrogenase component 2/CRP-like cAMP-binding protein
MSLATLAGDAVSPLSGDVRLTDEILAGLKLLRELQRRPPMYRFRGSVALRRFRAGEVIARQGERMATAFYALTAEDEFALLSTLCRAARPRRPDEELLARRDEARDRVERTGGRDAVLRLMEVRAPRLARPGEPVGGRDGPVTLVQEGELFNDAGCLEGMPHATTAVAVRDCYLLEMKADFLAAIQDDPVYKARADAAYRARVLRLQLARLPLFCDLSEDEFALVGDAVELRSVEPGEVILDEHEGCDGLYVVRAGLVRLVKNVSALLGPDDVADWTCLREKLLDGASGARPYEVVWRRLSADARSAVERGHGSSWPDAAARAVVIAALNHLITSSDFAYDPQVESPDSEVLPFGPGETARRKNRAGLETILAPALKPSRAGRAPECVIDYRSRGDAFGLSDLLLDRPCSATAVASGHANAVGRVELAWLPVEAFWRLLRAVPRLREPLVAETARQRQNEQRRLATPAWDDSETRFSDEAVRLGLIQGQQLLLIDLDRCTRCDECVRACAGKQSDGRSRLFLEGPRFRRHLVPTACRSCLDPVCLIGCPVGSIHRGAGRQIVIENWCIGCGLCGESCPYGAIQLHDLGIIPEVSVGWRFLPADAAAEGWQKREFRPIAWLPAATPFVLDRTVREQLTERGLPRDPRVFAFRYDLAPGAVAFNGATTFRLEITSPGSARVWVNGEPREPIEKPRAGRNVYTIQVGAAGLGTGSNVVAVEIVHPGEGVAVGEPLLQARMDAISSDMSEDGPAGLSGRPVTRRAAVCDLCADQPGGAACIRACPHDAALRVDARTGLPA